MINSNSLFYSNLSSEQSFGIVSSFFELNLSPFIIKAQPLPSTFLDEVCSVWLYTTACNKFNCTQILNKETNKNNFLLVKSVASILPSIRNFIKSTESKVCWRKLRAQIRSVRNCSSNWSHSIVGTLCSRVQRYDDLLIWKVCNLKGWFIILYSMIKNVGVNNPTLHRGGANNTIFLA